jgi:hypothetical protein
MGNLFFRKQPIDVIRSMRYHELRYWNEWHEVISKEEKRVADSVKGSGK